MGDARVAIGDTAEGLSEISHREYTPQPLR